MTGLDWGMIGLYFLALLGLTWYCVRKGRDTADDYFLAGRNLGWFIVGASIFASNIGSEHLVGLAGSGATDGVAMAHYELHAWCLLVLGLGDGAVLHAVAGLHHARVPRTAFQPRHPLGPLADLAGGLRADEDRGGHLRRRHRLRASSCPSCTSAPLDSFWIGSILVIVLTGAVHHARRAAGRGLHRGPANR